MTTAVVLEGQIEASQDQWLWKGLWRFAKDKKGSLQFEYKRVSFEVPPDMMDYVSFLDPASIAHSLNTKADAHPFKHKRGRRGRPPMSSYAKATSNSFASSGGFQSPSATTAATEPSPHESFDADTSSLQDLAMDISNEFEQSGGMGLPDGVEDSFAEEGDIASGFPVASEPPPSDAPSSSADRKPAPIPQSHPLLGLWKGQFVVHSAKGEEFVEETFFFHSVLGGEVLSQFKDLPPEPSFPFGLLKNHHLPTSLTGGTALPHGSPGTGAVDPTEGTVDNVKLEAQAKEEERSEEGEQPSILESLYKQVLVGFGRNAIGRFSVAALYDEALNELRCEKKYMNTKFAIKRGRRSHAEYALSFGFSNSATGGSSSGAQPPNPMTTRQADNSQAGEETGRTHRAAYHNNYYINNASKLNSDDSDGFPPSKRKRSNSTRSDYLPSVMSSKASKQELAQYYAEKYADHPLALVGSRNPDNDEVVEGFRDAFMDLETGEIYEGQWSGGLRQGYGMCVYGDGLMYEGQWLRGKESGKGILMTADRMVIYSGDWLDGMMHGTGEYRYGNGDLYVGDFKEGNRHGRGEYISAATQCRYAGDWRDNKRHGKGRFVWADDSYYDGEWDHDLRSGRGLLELASGFKYDGGWTQNVMEGKGICTYAPSNQTYQGTFKAGLRDGRGSILFAEGDAVYEGRFKEDRFDGQGTIKIAAAVEGASEDEVFVPIQIQPDFWRIHWKAGFGHNAH